MKLHCVFGVSQKLMPDNEGSQWCHFIHRVGKLIAIFVLQSANMSYHFLIKYFALQCLFLPGYIIK